MVVNYLPIYEIGSVFIVSKNEYTKSIIIYLKMNNLFIYLFNNLMI